jgi:DNA replication protein DnaC
MEQDFVSLDQAFTQDESCPVEGVTPSKISHKPETVDVIDAHGEIVETIPFRTRKEVPGAEWQSLVPMRRAALLRGMREYSANVDKAIATSAKYECSVCFDKKWFLTGSGVIPCTDCPDYADKAVRTISFKMEVAGLPTARAVKRLDEVQTDYQIGDGRRAFDKAFHLASTVVERNSPKLLVLVGSTGVGKSFLSEGIAYEMVRQQRQVFYVTGGLFADNMRPRFGKDRTDADLPGRQQFKNGLLNVDNLVFDEVGVGDDPFGAIADEYQDLFSRRFDRGLTTVIAGNIDAVYADPEEVQQWMLAGSPPDDTPVEKMSAEEHLAQVVGDRLVSRIKTGDGSAALASLWECRDARPLEKKARGK